MHLIFSRSGIILNGVTDILNCFVAACVSINTEHKAINSPLEWIFLACALELIECKMRWMFLMIEIANQYAPMPKAEVHAIIKCAWPRMMYSKIIAIKYPIGLFESNGNLLGNGSSRKFYWFNELFLQSMRFTTSALATEMIGFPKWWSSKWHSWLHMLVKPRPVVILSSAPLK